MGIYYFIGILVIVLSLTSFKRTRTFLSQYLPELLTAFGTIGLTITKLMSDSDKIFIGNTTWKEAWPYLFLFFSLTLLLAIIISAKRNVQNKNIKEEIKKVESLTKDVENYKLEYYKLCSTVIRNIFEDFYTSGNERISIYKFQEDHFVLLGRYAKNSAYNKRTEYQYQMNEGFIGIGWSEGEYFIDDIPKWKQSGRDYKEFVRQRCTISNSRLLKLKMKSRSMFIKTIDDNNTPDNPDGIVVFESLNPNKVKVVDCNALLLKDKKALLSLLKNMKSLTRRVNS